MSDNYANEIREKVRKYKTKKIDREQIMHRLDIECFGIKYKKSKSLGRRMGKCSAR